MAKTRAVSAAAAAAAAATAAIAGDPNAGPVALGHVITEVLNQPSDRTLAQALARAGITEIFNLLVLNQADRDSLTFLDENTLVTPLPLGLWNLLKAISIYGPFCSAQGRSITNWTEVTKVEFDKFRCSTKCYNATKFNAQVPTACLHPVLWQEESHSCLCHKERVGDGMFMDSAIIVLPSP